MNANAANADSPSASPEKTSFLKLFIRSYWAPQASADRIALGFALCFVFYAVHLDIFMGRIYSIVAIDYSTAALIASTFILWMLYRLTLLAKRVTLKAFREEMALTGQSANECLATHLKIPFIRTLTPFFLVLALFGACLLGYTIIELLDPARTALQRPIPFMYAFPPLIIFMSTLFAGLISLASIFDMMFLLCKPGASRTNILLVSFLWMSLVLCFLVMLYVFSNYDIIPQYRRYISRWSYNYMENEIASLHFKSGVFISLLMLLLWAATRIWKKAQTVFFAIFIILGIPLILYCLFTALFIKEHGTFRVSRQYYYYSHLCCIGYFFNMAAALVVRNRWRKACAAYYKFE